MSVAPCNLEDLLHSDAGKGQGLRQQAVFVFLSGWPGARPDRLPVFLELGSCLVACLAFHQVR
eukprot:4511598-Prorocentrum_lima.AAC.1